MKRPNHMTPLPLLQSVLFFLFVLNVCQLTVQAQDLPPAKYDGFVYTNHSVDSDTIMIEAFLDPVCPDSRDSWPPLKQAIEHYGSRVWLVVHLFPLSYHDNAFAASRAIHIVNILNPSGTFHLLEWFFKYQAAVLAQAVVVREQSVRIEGGLRLVFLHRTVFGFIQEGFYNAQTFNLSKASVVKDIVKFASAAVGNSYYSAIEAGFNDRKTDLITRVSFKYSASRGVFGTPFFFVNGFLLPDGGSPIGYNEWRKIIDPLVSAQGVKGEDSMHFFL